MNMHNNKTQNRLKYDLETSRDTGNVRSPVVSTFFNKGTTIYKELIQVLTFQG